MGCALAYRLTLGEFMSTAIPPLNIDPEIGAISVVYQAIFSLEPPAQQRVLLYVAGKLGLILARLPPSGLLDDTNTKGEVYAEATAISGISVDADEGDGISPIALKWMKRNGLTVDALSSLFSLGVDEIDLVAKAIPGKGKKERCLNVVLLKGIAQYLASGAARITQEQIKEACLHYDAFDAANFATNLKSFAPELSGSKASGFTLTARGLTNATELVKGLTQT